MNASSQSPHLKASFMGKTSGKITDNHWRCINTLAAKNRSRLKVKAAVILFIYFIIRSYNMMLVVDSIYIHIYMGSQVSYKIITNKMIPSSQKCISVLK